MISAPSTLKGRHFTRVSDWSREELTEALDLAEALREARLRRAETPLLSGRTLGLVFEKPSLRTRVSFEVGMLELGGHAVHLGGAEIGLGEREPLRDVAAVLSRYVDAIAIRTFAQRLVDELAAYSSVPVLNALTDEEHPCQAVADLLTIRGRFAGFDGVRIAYVGDGNNVCASLMVAAALVGAPFVAATPPGFEPPPGAVAEARRLAGASASTVELTTDPREAARGAHVLYTDVWTSMGQEAERERRLAVFKGFTVDGDLVALADPEAIVLHCLPAHRGEEIAADVLDGPRSAVLAQAENRLHAQKALLALVVS